MSKQLTLATGLAALAAFLIAPLHAQLSGVESAAEREIRRRELTAQYAQDAINNGTDALLARDYESAFAYFKGAVDSLPSGGEATASVRAQAVDGLGRAGVKLAEQRVSEGRYADAAAVLHVVLDARYNPDYKPARTLLTKIESPDTFNKTIGPAFVASVEEVKQLLLEAEGLFASARYDLAFKRCEQVLSIDRYNIAARRMMEKINNARSQYANEAYNESRASMLADVEKAWELPVTRFSAGPAAIVDQPAIDTRGTGAISRKLEEIRIPRIEFREATIREALDFLRARSKTLDTQEPDPNRRGVNIVLKLDPSARIAESSRITLTLVDVPLLDALRFTAEAANLKVKVEPYAVSVVPPTEPTDVLITKEYKVSPGFISALPAPAEAALPGAPPVGDEQGTTAGRSTARQFLESRGVTFPPGASANYLPTSSKLIVKNTPPNLDLVDQIVAVDAQTPPSQVEIESKFVEVSQNDLKELGFDWLLGQFALPFGTGVYGSGGTAGYGGDIRGTTITTINGTTVTSNSSFPLLAPGANGVPIGASTLSAGPITAGNRTGGTAITANAIDGLLFGTPLGAAPGVLALSGIFTNPQFQVVLRALDQRKGIDLVSSPKVVTKSGNRATIQIIREFRYPTQFDPPQIPQTATTTFTPISPTTPTNFETKNLGVELEVEPTVGPDGYSIELVLSPRVTEFDGFINYGSPIDTVAQEVQTNVVTQAVGAIVTGATTFGRPGTVRISDNVINQPIFSVRQVTTQVTVYDGQTVVLGGLMREDVQKVEDKTPILGDIPLVGRLFRTSADQHIKRNLIMFVSARLLDPAGQPLIREIEDDREIMAPDAAAVANEVIPGDPLSAPTQ